jgi:ribose/xylose/arabinose/galactoside ABC-type transport system permease subunit
MTRFLSRKLKVALPALNDGSSVPIIRLLVVFVAVMAICAKLQPLFLTGANLESAAVTYAAEAALVTAGQALAMFTAGIDLSVAGIVAVTGVGVGTLSGHGVPTAGLIVAGLAIGASCGLLNGFVIARLGVAPIMATLGSGILFEGISEGLSNGAIVSTFPGSFLVIGEGTWLGIPSQLWIVVPILVVLAIGVGRTRYGRWVYAVGANIRAAGLSGVPVAATQIGVYVVIGVLCAGAGLIETARLSSASPDMSTTLTLGSITAAVLGGVSIFGGVGTIFGAVLGVLTVSALESGLTLEGIATPIQAMIVAVILLVSLFSRPGAFRSMTRWLRNSGVTRSLGDGPLAADAPTKGE